MLTAARGRLVDGVERTLASTSELERGTRQEQLWWWREHLTELLRMTMLMLAELEDRDGSPTAR